MPGHDDGAYDDDGAYGSTLASCPWLRQLHGLGLGADARHNAEGFPGLERLFVGLRVEGAHLLKGHGVPVRKSYEEEDTCMLAPYEEEDTCMRAQGSWRTCPQVSQVCRPF